MKPTNHLVGEFEEYDEFEGYGLQPVHEHPEISAALAAEGWHVG
jgi:hypothetical protein